MAWAYVLFMTTSGWAMHPGYVPMQVPNCNEFIESKLDNINAVKNENPGVIDFQAGCFNGNLEELKAFLDATFKDDPA